jgi:5,6,7,8-tetrahydromethanopterin hydro-lyase
MSKESGIYVGEALVGEGNEIAHIDLLLGPKSGPVGPEFTSTLTRQTRGHSNLLAVLTPNKLVVPNTVTFSKVTIAGAKQAVQMFGPAQAAVAWAVGDELVAGTFKDLGNPNELCVIVGVFIHWEAESNEKIFRYNYDATRLAIQRAAEGGPTAEDVQNWVKSLEAESDLAHPFKGDFDLVATIKELRQKFEEQPTA